MEMARLLQEKCAEFDVHGSVTQIHPGPIVTTFEFKPDTGVKYSRVVSLMDDLCLAMRAESSVSTVCRANPRWESRCPIEPGTPSFAGNHRIRGVPEIQIQTDAGTRQADQRRSCVTDLAKMPTCSSPAPPVPARASA